MMAGVVLEHVWKLYGYQAAVKDATLMIGEGEFVVLLGPSGCGKTTTLRMIAGLIEATRGTILIGGTNVTSLPARKRNIGMVFQDYALFPHLDIARNVGFGLRERGADRATIAQRVTELLSLVRLSGFERRYPSQLSGGQQQRVALARALACSPAVLLMDEPLGALDLKLREAMQTELRRLQRELRITTVFVTHDQTEAMALADRIAVMSDGHIEQMGTPEEIYRQPASEFVATFVGKINFFEGSVRQVSNGRCTAVLDDGNCVEAVASPDARPGDRIKLGVRPENLLLSSDNQAGAGLCGTIEQRRYFGNIVQYLIRSAGDQPLLAEQGTGSPVFDAGDRVVIGWRSDDVLAFSGTSGRE
jgi:putative spermidine/putrescine transport system ATP-binding protein